MDAVKGEKSFIKLEDGRVLDVIEILGRPITLQDVIVALYIGEENFEKASYIAGTDWEKLYFKSHFTGEIFIYNLSKPFSEQSDEFYQWCAEQLWYNS